MKQSGVRNRLCWTILFIFVYVLGSKITLPFVDLAKVLNVNEGTARGLELTSAIMGGNLRGLSIFALGLSPWMSSMILWRLFTVSKRHNLERTSSDLVERRKMYLTLALALVQSLAVSLYLPLETDLSPLLVVSLNALIMIAGTFFLVWLADLNTALGLGNSIVIMMAGMLLYLPEDVLGTLSKSGLPAYSLLFLFLLLLAFMYMVVCIEYARYRIPVNKLGIHNSLKAHTFLDVKLNPAGGMPFMYAMTLVSIPQYIFLLVQAINPHASWAGTIAKELVIGEPAWIFLYGLMMVLLSFAFAFVTVNGEEIADKMMKNSEYIDFVYPGEETRGTLYLILFTVLPFLLLLWDRGLLRLVMIPGSFLMFVGMISTIREEVRALRVNQRYTRLF